MKLDAILAALKKLPISLQEIWVEKSSLHKEVVATSENEKLPAAMTSKTGEKTIMSPCCSWFHPLISVQRCSLSYFQEKRSLVRINKICLRCLRSNHMIRECKVKTSCSVEGCDKILSHPNLLPGYKLSIPGDRVKEPGRYGNDDGITTNTTMFYDVSASSPKCTVPEHIGVAGTFSECE